MSKNILQYAMGLLIIAFLCFAQEASAATEINSNITVPANWTKDGSPYLVKKDIYIDAPLIIEPGVIVKFDYMINSRFKITVRSELTAIGTETDRIIFTSGRDDSFGGDTNNDGNLSSPASGNWDSISFNANSKGRMEYVSVLYGIEPFKVYGSITIINTDDVIVRNSEIKYSGYYGIFIHESAPIIENNIISNNRVGIAVGGRKKVVVSNNVIANNGGGAAIFGIPIAYDHLDARNNWWGDISGPYYARGMYSGGEIENLDGKGNSVNYGVRFDPWLDKVPGDEDIGCQENCYSNILFLPGIKASHLYKYDSDTDYDLDELWVPNWLGSDVEELELDNDGKSIKKVFTKEGAVLKDTIMGDLYESFLADLDKLKVDNVIGNYKSFAYDWRQSVEDIAKNGTPYQLETDKIQLKLIQDEINALAQSSKSDKVTIVAHSNGGLVAKAVMVENPELAAKVDKIILVASPQMGTPRATLSLLYGQEESIPTLLSQKKARALVENMPGAYGLLPSAEYLTRQRDAGDALINFSSENSERGLLYKNSYGDKIDSLDEFRDFLLAKEDNREKPEKDEVDLENVLNEDILDEAITTHSKIDNWTPPAGVKVIQLGGWGLPTVSGIEYKEKKNETCLQREITSFPVCVEEEGKYTLIPEPKWTVDGDKIVTTPSGLMMPVLDNVERYWFDIKRNKSKIEHKNILEANNVRDFIKNEIRNIEADLPEYISIEKPADYEGMKPRIKMSLYSPLDIHLYDSSGNHTGYKEIMTDEGPQRIIEENIPNSFYFQLGDVKYVSFEKGENVKVRLDGYEEGSYTLKIEEVRDIESGEEIINHVTFKNLPTSENTEVNLVISEGGLKNISNLEADYNGDNIDDYVLTPIVGEEVTLPDVTSPIIEISSPQNKTYLKNEIIKIDYIISDDRSALGNIKVEKLLDNKVMAQGEIDSSLLKVGEHKVTVRATDEANNVGEKSVIFNVSTNLPILMKNIDHFYSLKLIKSNQEKKMIINNLSIIEKEMEFYNSIKNNIFIKSKVKKILLSILGNQIENHIDAIIKKIEKDRKNYVTMIKEVIVDDLDYIKINFNK